MTGQRSFVFADFIFTIDIRYSHPQNSAMNKQYIDKTACHTTITMSSKTLTQLFYSNGI